MKIIIVYLVFIVALVYLTKKAGDRKLSPSLWVPFIWMLQILSRPLYYWLGYRGDLSGMEAEMVGNPIDAAFISILIIIGLRILYARRLDIKRIFENNKALIIFYGFALLSLLWADFPSIAFKRWIRWFGVLVMMFVILTDKDPKAAISSLVKRCAYVLIPLSIVFIKFVPHIGRSYSPSGAANYHGVASQKNGYGILLLIFGIYFFWELINAWRIKDSSAIKKIIYINLIFLVVIFWQLLFINAITALTCLVIGIISLIWLNLPFSIIKPKRAVNQILVFAIIVLALQQVVDIKSEALSAMGRDPTLTDRTEIWKAVLAVPINRWVGTGWDNFWLGDRIARLWERWWWQPRSAHNGYIEIYLYLGIVGIILLTFVLVETFKRSTSLLISDFEYGCLSLTFLIVTLLINYSESSFHRGNPVWFFLLLFSRLSIPRKYGKGFQENTLFSR